MLILDQQISGDFKVIPQARSFSLKKPLLYTSIFIGLGILIIPAIISFANLSQPTGTYLDPRPQQQLASAPATPTPTPTSVSPEQLVLSAQAYLEKALAVSNKSDQTTDDKQQIITLLNQSLDYSNQAVTAAPNSPQSYLIRARVLATSSSIRPDALQLAQKDLETAQKLSGGQPVDLPTQVNLLNLSPTQQASLAQNLIIATPADAQDASTSSQTSSNVAKSAAAIPATKTEVTITNTEITADSYLYVIATTPGNPIFIKTKAAGKAIIATTSPSPTPINFEYWIVKP